MDDSGKAAREERLRVALRENLKRRKAQAKGRAAPPPERGGDPPAPADADVIGPSDRSKAPGPPDPT